MKTLLKSQEEGVSEQALLEQEFGQLLETTFRLECELEMMLER